MLFEDFFKKDLAALKEHLADLQKQVCQATILDESASELEKEFPDLKDATVDFKEEVALQAHRGSVVAGKLTAPDTEHDLADYGLFLSVSVHSLEAATAVFQDRLAAAHASATQPGASQSQSQSASVLAKVRQWVQQHIVPILMKILRKAWQILSNLLTPKGWKVSGGIGTFLGLAKAELEISFGK